MRRAVEEDAILRFPEKDRELAGLLIQAARDEIHRDFQKAHSHYKTFLLRIKDKLTDPTLDVNDARSAAGLTGTSTYAAEFSRIVGMNPAPYIECHRMELARRLFQYTEASVSCVAFAVGYENSNHFSDRYKNFSGHRPLQETKADSRTTASLLERLRRSAAKQQRTSDQKIPMKVDLQAELCCGNNITRREGASAFWEEIHDLDRQRVMDYIYTNSDALDIHHFNFLLAKSKIEGRRSRERGEDLALIALDCLRAIEFRKGREFLDEKVLGYAVLANTRRLRLDFAGAKEAFRAIDKFRLDDVRLDVVLQLNIFRAYFLWWWKRDVKTSKKMVELLLSEVRNYGSFEFLAMVLHLAGDIHETSGHPDRALSMFEEAEECSRFIEDPFIVASTHYNLSYLYASLSNGKKAFELFEKVKQLHEDADWGISATYLTLLEARIHRANGDLAHAEPQYLEAREGFTALGLDIYVALVSLELALLYLDLAEPERAFTMAIASMDCISRYSCHKEAMTALAVLQEASRTTIINKAMLTQALRHLEMVRKDPITAVSAK